MCGRTFRGLKDRETFVVFLQVNSNYKFVSTFFMAPLCHLFSSVRSESIQAVTQAPPVFPAVKGLAVSNPYTTFYSPILFFVVFKVSHVEDHVLSHV